MDPEQRPCAEDEEKRYRQHNNDVNDPRYQQFVSPLVDKVLQKYDQNHYGLDFGAGPGPVVSKLLGEKGISMALYDPFFWNDRSVFNKKYHFIICCEVIEHFRQPVREFILLKNLLQPSGSIYCMTEILSNKTDFMQWYYKNDPTHLFFYRYQTLLWIKNKLGFSNLTINNRVIHFEV